MSNFWRDIRLTARIACRAPTATVGLLITMAVAVAGCATVFAVVNAVLWRPLPFADPARLMHVQATDATGANRFLSVPIWDEWKAGVRDVALAAYTYADFSIVDGGEPETLIAALVSPDLLDVVGVAPAYGRAFQPSDAAGGERTVILTHSFWTRRFGADPKIVGTVVKLTGPEHMDDIDGAYRVAGVMPRHFWLFAKRLDVLVPFRSSAEQMTDRTAGVIEHVIGRVSNGRSIEHGAAEIESIAIRVFTQNTSTDPVVAARAQDLRTFHFGDVRSRLVLLLVAALTALLLAAMNIAALLMAQMVGRRQEFDIRVALGASRMRLIRQIVIEALALGGTGGVLGVVLGAWAIALVRSQLPAWMLDRIPNEAAAIQLDPTVAIVLVLAVLIVSIMSGLAATLLLGVARTRISLTTGTKGGTAAPQKLHVRAGIVGLQVVLSTTLLLTTLVLAENHRRLVAVDLGLTPEHVVSYWLNPPRARYPTDASRTEFFDAAIARTRGLPGVERVGGVDVPFYWDRPRLRVMKDGQTADRAGDLPTALPRAVTADYFATIGIRLLKGRLFESSDAQGSPSVAVVSRRTADLLWPGEEAIGRTIRPGGPSSQEPWSTVVGVVEDVRYRPHAAPFPIVYRPVSQKAPAWLYLTVRTRGEPSTYFSAIPRAVWSVDKELPIDGPYLAATWVANLLAGLRLSVIVAWMFAALALVLSITGLYGLTAHAIGQSTREIGIRKALGATDRSVMNLFVRRVAPVIVPALCVGTLASAGALRLIRVEIDGLTLQGIWWLAPACSVLFGFVCAAAAYVPLLRIRSVDPALSMRAE
jgi:putative ABC transport system permease protein